MLFSNCRWWFAEVKVNLMLVCSLRVFTGFLYLTPDSVPVVCKDCHKDPFLLKNL